MNKKTIWVFFCKFTSASASLCVSLIVPPWPPFSAAVLTLKIGLVE